MPDPILADPTLIIVEWYRWGVAVAFAITFITTLWIFFDSQSNNYGATLWRVVSLLSAIVIIPSVILSLFPELATGLGSFPTLLAFLGPIATLISLLSLLLYTVGIGVHAFSSEAESLDYDPVPVSGRDTNDATDAQKTSSTKTEPQTPVTSQTIVGGPPLNDDLTQVFSPPQHQRRPLAWVVALNGPHIGKTYRLKDLVDIGRDSKHNDISLDDRTISRQHARIRQEDDEFVIYDLVSANGIDVNGETVQRQVLQNGDRIVIGQIELGFLRVREEDSRTEVKKAPENDVVTQANMKI